MRIDFFCVMRYTFPRRSVQSEGSLPARTWPDGATFKIRGSSTIWRSPDGIHVICEGSFNLKDSDFLASTLDLKGVGLVSFNRKRRYSKVASFFAEAPTVPACFSV